MHNNKNEYLVRPTVTTSEERPRLLISPRLQAHVNLAHELIGECEWSGCLYFTIEQGSQKNMKELVLLVHDFYPMNIGSPGFTSFEYGTEMLRAMKDCPAASLPGVRLALIHTHHSMGAFYSGVDMNDLQENAPHYPFYLSVVTDFQGLYIGRIAEAFKLKTEMLKNFGQGYVPVQSEEKAGRVYYDCRVNKVAFAEDEVKPELWFENRMLELIERHNYVKPVRVKEPGRIAFPDLFGDLIPLPSLDEDVELALPEKQEEILTDVVRRALLRMNIDHEDVTFRLRFLLRKNKRIIESKRGSFAKNIDNVLTIHREVVSLSQARTLREELRKILLQESIQNTL